MQLVIAQLMTYTSHNRLSIRIIALHSATNTLFQWGHNSKRGIYLSIKSGLKQYGTLQYYIRGTLTLSPRRKVGSHRRMNNRVQSLQLLLITKNT